MSWQDRVKTAAYTSPGGVRTEFTFEALRRELNLRGSQYNFIDEQGTYIQGTGSSGRSFPFNVIINGTDYDIDAEVFFESLREPGTGTLEHPLYGTVNVVPLGTVVQLENLVSNANQAVFQVTFWESITELFPSGVTNLTSSLLSGVSEFATTVTNSFVDILNFDTQIEFITIINHAIDVTNTVYGALTEIASTGANIFDAFEDVFDGMKSSLLSNEFTPTTFAGQLIALTHGPAKSKSDWDAKQEGYQAIVNFVLTMDDVAETRDSRSVNDFILNDLTATVSLTGLIISTVTTTFVTRSEAITAAQSIIEMGDQINTWRETNYENLDVTDTGESYQQWQEAVALAAAYLVDVGFSLAQERIILLDRPRSIIDLSAELYGEVENRLDFLISSNDMTGDEIIEGLQPGRQVKYYV